MHVTFNPDEEFKFNIMRKPAARVDLCGKRGKNEQNYEHVKSDPQII